MIRAKSQHAQCSTCVRHRHMVKRLGHHLTTRREQQRFYHEHLRDQYADRMIYYQQRALSRAHESKVITIIQDGMDQQKVSIPRSPMMFGKELAMLQKAKLHVSLTLVHGYFMLWVLSDPDCQKDSNASVETLAHAMDILQNDFSLNLSEYSFVVHADNTCREVKNNHCFRFAAAQVSCDNVRRWSYRFLRCGHSREDVDQCFGRLARHLSKTRLAQTPDDMLQVIADCATSMHRPHESKRYVVKMDQSRDWCLACAYSVKGCHHFQQRH